MSELFSGAGTLLRGVAVFYRSPRFWRYGLAPMLLVLALYGMLLWVTIGWLLPMLVGCLPEPEAWGAAWKWLLLTLRVLGYLLGVVTLTAAGLAFFSTLFEAFGALFFDALVVRFEREELKNPVTEPNWRESLRLLPGALWFSVLTMAWTLLLLPVTLLVPVVGFLPSAAVVGYRLGTGYLFSSLFARRLAVSQLRPRLAGNRRALFGFGVTAYLLLLIPFSAVFLLPGFALGGALFYHERLTAGGRD